MLSLWWLALLLCGKKVLPITSKFIFKSACDSKKLCIHEVRSLEGLQPVSSAFRIFGSRKASCIDFGTGFLESGRNKYDDIVVTC